MFSSNSLSWSQPLIIVGKRFPTQVMRDYLPVCDPLSIFAPQTPVYLLCAIGSLRYNKWNRVITRLPGLTSSRTLRFLFGAIRLISLTSYVCYECLFLVFLIYFTQNRSMVLYTITWLLKYFQNWSFSFCNKFSWNAAALMFSHIKYMYWTALWC